MNNLKSRLITTFTQSDPSRSTPAYPSGRHSKNLSDPPLPLHHPNPQLDRNIPPNFNASNEPDTEAGTIGNVAGARPLVGEEEIQINMKIMIIEDYHSFKNGMKTLSWKQVWKVVSKRSWWSESKFLAPSFFSVFLICLPYEFV